MVEESRFGRNSDDVTIITNKDLAQLTTHQEYTILQNIAELIEYTVLEWLAAMEIVSVYVNEIQIRQM